MNLEQIVKETVAKMVDEKHLTAAETKPVSSKRYISLNSLPSYV
jgi:hypothetical protein